MGCAQDYKWGEAVERAGTHCTSNFCPGTATMYGLKYGATPPPCELEKVIWYASHSFLIACDNTPGQSIAEVEGVSLPVCGCGSGSKPASASPEQNRMLLFVTILYRCCNFGHQETNLSKVENDPRSIYDHCVSIAVDKHCKSNTGLSKIKLKSANEYPTESLSEYLGSLESPPLS
jgi:hypothetical protein